MKQYEKGMVGRTITYERARELNVQDYFYQMLKDNPKLAALYPGIEDNIMEGAIDHHIHAYPDFVFRSQDMIEVSIDAANAGMRAVGFKDHWNHTGGCAFLTQRYIDDMVKRGELARGIEVYGGIGLNLGMNPQAVHEGLKYPNTKMLYFPTFNSGGYMRSSGQEANKNTIWLCDDNNEVLPNVKEIIDMATEKKVGIAFGHTDFIELVPLCEYAKKVGARVILDHPLIEVNKLTIDEMKVLADLGAYVGTYCQPMIPSLYQPLQDPMETIQAIKAIGPERCIIASDFGQVLHVLGIEGVRIFVRALLGLGIEEEDIRTMIKGNVEKLLWLDE
ncbi:DUF6282 family protein [Selenomonadales bacterium OttesenSCG-928-I06]|nr:DUF6282 family protein [Selenomonadales bacterium OttesenSCG-928-I06]